MEVEVKGRWRVNKKIISKINANFFGKSFFNFFCIVSKRILMNIFEY